MSVLSGQEAGVDELATLRAANPTARIDKIHAYVGAFLEFQEATANIREHGAMVVHPKTGAPIENPYVSVRDRAQRIMLGLKGLDVGPIWGEAPAAPQPRCPRAKGRRRAT